MHLQNHSFHSDWECISGANFVKNSVIFSCFPDANAVTRYNFNNPNSNFLTAVRRFCEMKIRKISIQNNGWLCMCSPVANECSNLLNKCPSKWFQISRSDCKSCEFIACVIWSMILSTRKPLSLSIFSSVSNDFNVLPKPRNSRYSRISESTYWMCAIISYRAQSKDNRIGFCFYANFASKKK